MSVSRASVHPVEAPTLQTMAANAPRVRMKDIQGMPGTISSLFLRFAQFVFASVALSVMASTSDFSSVTAFCYFVAAAGLQILWSISLGILDIYALLVGRSLQNQRIVSLFSVGDGVTSTLMFAAACASAGITVLLGNDLGICSQNHCTEFETATAMSFLCWFAAMPSFILNFWSMSSQCRCA